MIYHFPSNLQQIKAASFIGEAFGVNSGDFIDDGLTDEPGGHARRHDVR